MKRALGYGLILLAASGVATRTALALSSGAEVTPGSDGALYFLGGPGASSAHGAQGYLGVDLRDVPADQIAALRLKDARGAEIVKVDHDAPAGKAGLREHDIVLQLNGQAIMGGDQIRRMLHECAPGKTVTLLISRDGQQMTITTQMTTEKEVERQAWEQHLTVPESLDAPDSANSDFSAGSAGSSPSVRGGSSFIGTLLMNPSYTGAILETMSTQQATFFGVFSGTGLLVRTVVPNSPASIAGLQVCDVVVRADDKPMATNGDWVKALKNSHGHPLTIVVLRDKKQQILTLTPDSKKRSSLESPIESFDHAVIAHLGFPWNSHS
jgi:membrane-associated protease RseP (regulator of RpoE activity)